MNDPSRLLASADASALEKELLESWRDECPSAGARDKTLVMLGLGTTAATAAGSIAPKAIASGWALVAKWIAVGALVVGAATGVGIVIARHRHAATATNATTVVTIASPRLHLAPSPPPPTTTPTSATVLEMANAPTERASHPRGAAPASSSILEQVAELDRARNALGSGDRARALGLVDAYEAAHPNGAFLQEAEVVRIESLVDEGRAAEAHRAGRRFLANYPTSPHDARVRALVGDAP